MESISACRVRSLPSPPDLPSPLAQRIVTTGRALVERGLVVGSVGNVSARIPSGFLITPTRMPYHEMGSEHLVPLDLDGAQVGPPRPVPSREWPLHAAIYRARPDVSAVVHTHSVHATAWSFLPQPLELRLEESRYYSIGRVATAPPAEAGSPQLGNLAASALAGSSAALLGRHGLVAVGATPEEALIVAEVVEREAQVAWLLRAA